MWIPRFRQGGYTRFDPRTEKFQTWLVPPEYNDARAIQPQVAAAPDGTAWFPGGESLLIFKVDPETGKVTAYPMYPEYHPDEKSSGIIQFSYSATPIGHSTYGLAADSKSNIYICDIVGGNIGKIDGKTGKVTLYKTPTLNSGPLPRVEWIPRIASCLASITPTKARNVRSENDAVQRVDCADAVAGPLSRERRIRMGERPGHPEWAPIWSIRLDPKTGKFTEYMLPTVDANIRHIDVDNSTSPVAVWVAEVHQGKIARIEPLD